MNIIISGYGRMGKEVEKICLSRNHKIIAKIDTTNDWNQLSSIDYTKSVVIDFSIPSVAINNYLVCFKLGIPVVTGTTGWYDKFDYVIQQCTKQNCTFFYARNFSIGVNIFLKASTYLARLMAGFNNYNVHINETHHTHKVDSPSGTAIAIADNIINLIPTLDGWSLNNDKDKSSLPIYAYRKGEVTGKHQIVYESHEDKIILQHEAKNRSGFALGAVLAAEFIIGKHGVFTMDDLLKTIV